MECTQISPRGSNDVGTGACRSCKDDTKRSGRTDQLDGVTVQPTLLPLQWTLKERISKAKHSPERGIHVTDGIDPAAPKSERLQIHAVDRTSTGIGTENIQILILNTVNVWVGRRRVACNLKADSRRTLVPVHVLISNQIRIFLLGEILI